MSWKTADTERQAFTAAQEIVTGRVYCPSCQSMMPREGGRMKTDRLGRKRFLCRLCVSRTKPGAR